MERANDGTSPLEGSVDADVVIVGGGLTGIWTAIELKRRDPALDVRLLEAATCGSGASGANAGYLMNLWPKFLSLLQIAGESDAIWLARASEDAVAETIAFSMENKLDIGLQPSGVLWAASNDAQRGAWDETLTALRNVPQMPLRELASGELSAFSGTPAVVGGVVDETSAGIHPGLLVRSLRASALRLGVGIHERTPVTAIRRRGGTRIMVGTPSGSVRCTAVGLAINAWAAQFPEARSRLAIVASDTMVTDPFDGAREIVPRPIYDSRRRLDYLRSTEDGRIVFGKGGIHVAFGGRGSDTMWGPPPMRELRASLARYSGVAAAVPVAAAWRAPVEYSSSSLPFCGHVGGLPVWYVTGYSGDGLGPSRLMAKILASLLVGAADDWASSALARPPEKSFPREPLRWMGAQVVSAAIRRVERREDCGTRPSWLLQRAASVDPTHFSG
jgi:glycine/D-amino acid oxidase-like deaminating enzyme